MTERYVMANIKMPIRINADGSTDPFAEYMTFDLEECNKIDDTIPRTDIQSSFKESLSKLFKPLVTSTVPFEVTQGSDADKELEIGQRYKPVNF